jgi:hypothetical protein
MKKGIKTYVVGFGDQVDPDELNAIACAGGTATDQSICVQSGGCTTAKINQLPAFLQADNAAELTVGLSTIAKEVDCSPVI